MSDDEFDSLPDPFEGIDWDKVSIPALSSSSQVPASTTDTLPAAFPDYPPNSPHSSDQYTFDDVDEAFLNEVSILEAQFFSKETGSTAVQPSSNSEQLTRSTASSQGAGTSSPGGSQTTVVTNPRENCSQSTFTTCQKRASQEISSHVQNKRPRIEEPLHTPEPIPGGSSQSPPKDEKTRDSSRAVKDVLQDIEDELTCPICCDIFAYAHLGNPCGHSYCGECGWSWISKNKSSPTCAICRSKLASTAPMIPNFSMDNTVEKHIHALASSGASEWEEKGSKYVEWEQRKERWRNGAKDRMSQIKPKPQLVETDSEGEVYSFGISTESIESIPPPVTRPRRTRQNRGSRRGRHSNRNNDGGGNTPVAGGSRRSSGRHSEGRRR